MGMCVLLAASEVNISTFIQTMAIRYMFSYVRVHKKVLLTLLDFCSSSVGYYLANTINIAR